MNCLLIYSLENKMPIEMIYIGSTGDITQRSVIVRKISVDSILAFDLGKQQLRSFKRTNILSVGKIQRKRGIYYA